MKCCLFFCFIISVSSAFECPSSQWFRFRNKCFSADHSKWITFQENVNFCESLNATTVSIHSEEENSFIQSKLIKGYTFWLGITRVDFDAMTYAWLDGTLYNYSNWDWRHGRKSCAGASIEDGKWRDVPYCDLKYYAFCQIDFDSSFYKMQLQINQLQEDLKDDRKAQESRFNETNARLDKALNTTFAWITNLNSTFEAKLHEKENRSNKSFEKLEDKMNLLNLSMIFMESDIQLDLNNKDIQVDNIKKEMAQHRLVDNKLEEALNTQNYLIANMSSDLMKKEMEIKSTNQELVRLSLIITRLENAIYTQNDLIQRTDSTSEPKSTKN